MTDKEIIKALECCPDAITGVDCRESKCPAFQRGCIFFVKDGNMNGFVELIPRKLIEETSQLITCRKSQIEDLKEALEERVERIKVLEAEIEQLKERFDANIRKFAERLEDDIARSPHGYTFSTLLTIDTLVKEMTEETDNA